MDPDRDLNPKKNRTLFLKVKIQFNILNQYHVGDKFWGEASGWHDKKMCLLVELICVVARHFCLN